MNDNARQQSVKAYFDGIAAKDMSQVPWARDATLRTPLNPAGGETALIRGHRLDGTGTFPFASPNGELTLAAAGQSGHWRLVQSSLLQAIAPGCYGIQVDGDGFSEVIVFAVQAGPAPPD